MWIREDKEKTGERRENSSGFSLTPSLPPDAFPHIMLVDMNSFFASVEQQANPFLRNQPVGVGNSLHETSCLIATSKEAKALGIKTATVVYKAKKIYPKIQVVQSDPDKYREVHRRVNRIFRDYSESVEVYSIDESFLDLRESKHNPMKVGMEIKKRIKSEVGEWLTCSIGISQNKFLAKLAADLEKPDGLSLVWREQLPLIYQNKNFRDLWGFSHGWEKRLTRLGLISPAQLLGYPVQNLISVFGKSGFYLWQRINGLEEDEVRNHHSDPKSFGNSWVLNFRTTQKEKLRPVIMRLAEKAARRMRAENFQAYGMAVSITLVNGVQLARSKKLDFSINTGLAFYQEVMVLWQDWKIEYDVLHIAVKFTHLIEHTKQLGLFGNSEHDLNLALDQINDKYGEFTVRSGTLASTSSFAPDTVAFGK